VTIQMASSIMAQIIVVDFNMRHFFALLALEVKLEILFSPDQI
jgi:hypothetical protein